MPKGTMDLQSALPFADPRPDCVCILDDDPEVRRIIHRMLTQLGVDVFMHGSAHDFIADATARASCDCLILDVRLPDMSGLQLHRLLRSEPRAPAVIFVSGFADVTMAVDAMRDGAADFLQKPFREQQLLESVQRALRARRTDRASEAQRDAIDARKSSLTPRETEVLATLLRGMRAKEIGVELGISAKTAEEHRANVMHKMNVSSVAALIALFRANQ